jgi:anaerobic selenocysteine-containing dehydrogenase
VRVLGACPLDCPDACSWIVTVDDGGRATAMRGNPEHPFTRGALCVKVNRYLEQASSPERVTYPLRRVGKKGEGAFERITWDEALDEIAERLTGILAGDGGEAIWPFHGMGSLGYLQGLEGPAGQRFFNALGASRSVSTTCSVAGARGLKYAQGTSAGMDPEDLAHAKLILLWGTNPLSTGHHIWKFITGSDAHLVAIDPIRTRTAARAHEHIAPLPGTDAALAFGLLNVIVEAGAQDTGFLAERTLGWPEFEARIKEFPPGRVAEICGIDEGVIRALGERVATTRPTAIRATQGMQRHDGGGAAFRALACIPAVTGDWRRRGGGICHSTSGHFHLNEFALARPDLRPRQAARTLTTSRIGAGLLEADPPVKALFVVAANPAASNPQQDRVRRGLAREDLFTVVLEHFLTDTADYADIVLPATMQTEHTDVVAGYGHLYLLWNEAAVTPPGECLPATETFRRLARRMGLPEPALYDSDEDLARALLDTGEPLLAGVTVERLRAEGWVRLNVPRPFLPFGDGFPTPSGRFEFVSEAARRDGFDPMPGYTPPGDGPPGDAPPGDGGYPLALISAASHHFLNSMFANNPELRRRSGPPRVVLHPADAAARGLADGDAITVANGRGAFEAVAQISDVVRPGVAATTKGRWVKATGANVNATTGERDADMGGGAVFHDNRVEVTPRGAGR